MDTLENTNSHTQQPAVQEEQSGLVARLDSIARGLIFVVVLLLPLLVVPAGWLPFPTVKMGFLALGTLGALVLWSVARLREHRLTFPNTHVIWTALLLLIGYVLAGVLASDVSRSLVGFGFERDTVLAMFTLIGALVAVAVTTQKVGHFLRLQQAALGAFLIIGLFQIIRVTFGADTVLPSLFSSDPTATLLGSWNDLAVYSGLALLMSLTGLAVFAARKMARGALYLTLVVALFLLIVVNLSAVWATLALATFILAIYIFSDSSYDRESGKFVPRIPWKRLLPSLVVLVISIVFLVAGAAIGQRVSQTFNIAYLDVRPSWEGTTIVGAGVFKDNALLGVGPNSFRDAWIDHRPVGINETNFWDTDFNSGVGLIPTAFVNGGLVVGVLWLLFFVAFVHLGIKMLARRITQLVHMYVAISSYIGVAYLWVLSIVYVPQTVILAYTFIFTGAVIAVAHMVGTIGTKEVRSQNGYASGLMLYGTMSLVFVIALGALLVHAERASTASVHSRAVAVANAGDLERAESMVEGAGLFGTDVRSLQLKTNVGLTELATLLNEETDDVEGQRAKFQEALQKTISSAQALVAEESDNYRNWLLLGSVYARLVPLNVEGAYENAVQAYEKAQELNPKSPSIPANLSRLALINADYEGAQAHANQALQLKSNYTDAYYLLSQVAIQVGNVEDAIQTTQAAVVLRPGNAGLLFQLGILNYSIGSFEQAVQVLEGAVNINPNYANALYFLGLAYEQTGNPENALVAFERVAALNPDNVEVQQIVTALTEGGTAASVIGESANAELGQPPVSEQR